MNAVLRIKRGAAAVALLSMGMGMGMAVDATQSAHAGAPTGRNSVPTPVLLGPSIQASAARHAKCIYEEGVCLYTFTLTLKITGSGFYPNGPVILYVRHNTAGAAYHTTSATSTPLFGKVSVDTNRPYCASSGWQVKAFDVQRQQFSNTVDVAPC